MFYLVACIFCSAILYIIFKGFEKYKIDLLQAIVVNYFIAAILGFGLAKFYGQEMSVSQIVDSKWANYTLIIGLMFISIFNLMGISSQKVGVSVTSVANKMSVVLPVVFGFIFLNEVVTELKVIGICLAVLALYFTTLKNKSNGISKLIIFPIIIFITSGILDILLGYCSKTYIASNNMVVFTSCLFSVAAILGLMYLLILVIVGKQKIQGKNIIGGIILGIPNFGSILFVFEGLKATQWDVSVFYPVLNMGVVVLATILGWFVFKEKLSIINMVGIALAIVSIYLISF